MRLHFLMRSVPLLAMTACALSLRIGLTSAVMSVARHMLQPGFAAVSGSRVEACNARWLVRIAAVDCQPVQGVLRAAAVPGDVLVVEGVQTGFAALVGSDGVRLVTRSPHIVARLG